MAERPPELDAAIAAELKQRVEDLNRAASRAQQDGLTVEFSTIEIGSLNRARRDLLDVSVSRPL